MPANLRISACLWLLLTNLAIANSNDPSTDAVVNDAKKPSPPAEATKVELEELSELLDEQEDETLLRLES